MPFLIDGNNLMGTMTGMRMGDPEAQRRFVQELLSYQRLRKKGIVVVFDGLPETGAQKRDRSLGAVTVRYSGAGVSADDVIAGMLAKATPEHYVLVTSDRELQARARALRVKVTGCREFLAEMEEEGKKAEEKKASGRPLSAAEVEEWMRLFRRPKP